MKLMQQQISGMVLITAFLAATLASSALANPGNKTPPAPKVNRVPPAPQAGCDVREYKHLDWALKNCMHINIVGLKVPKLCRPLLLELKDGATLTFKNRIEFGYCEFEGFLITIRGNKVHVNGEKGSVLDAQGARYWDNKGDFGKKKPIFFRIETTDSHLSGITLLNCPNQCVSIYDSHNTVISGWTVDVSKGDEKVAPAGKEGKNTDGFDVGGSSYLTFEDITVHNQDDCVVINSGMHLMFRNIHCVGRTHGLSIAVGIQKALPTSKTRGKNNNMVKQVPPNVVQNVTFVDSTLIKAMYGVRIKTVPSNNKGIIKDVTYRNIVLKDVDYRGIVVRQDYGRWGKPQANVLIQNLKLRNIRGNVWGKDASVVVIGCATGGCSDFDWKEINIQHTGGLGRPNLCNYQPRGFKC